MVILSLIFAIALWCLLAYVNAKTHKAIPIIVISSVAVNTLIKANIYDIVLLFSLIYVIIYFVMKGIENV